MPRGQPTWTPESITSARALYTQQEPRLTREQIAEALGVTVNALRNALARIGVHAGSRPGWTRGRGIGWANPGKQPSGRVVVVQHRLTCLGAVEPQHKFWSDDPRRQRVCNRCRAAMAGVMEEFEV